MWEREFLIDLIRPQINLQAKDSNCRMILVAETARFERTGLPITYDTEASQYMSNVAASRERDVSLSDPQFIQSLEGFSMPRERHRGSSVHRTRRSDAAHSGEVSDRTASIYFKKESSITLVGCQALVAPEDDEESVIWVPTADIQRERIAHGMLRRVIKPCLMFFVMGNHCDVDLQLADKGMKLLDPDTLDCNVATLGDGPRTESIEYQPTQNRKHWMKLYIPDFKMAMESMEYHIFVDVIKSTLLLQENTLAHAQREKETETANLDSIDIKQLQSTVEKAIQRGLANMQKRMAVGSTLKMKNTVFQVDYYVGHQIFEITKLSRPIVTAEVIGLYGTHNFFANLGNENEITIDYFTLKSRFGDIQHIDEKLISTDLLKSFHSYRQSQRSKQRSTEVLLSAHASSQESTWKPHPDASEREEGASESDQLVFNVVAPHPRKWSQRDPKRDVMLRMAAQVDPPLRGVKKVTVVHQLVVTLFPITIEVTHPHYLLIRDYFFPNLAAIESKEIANRFLIKGSRRTSGVEKASSRALKDVEQTKKASAPINLTYIKYMRLNDLVFHASYFQTLVPLKFENMKINIKPFVGESSLGR
jgi:hypothetical protein